MSFLIADFLALQLYKIISKYPSHLFNENPIKIVPGRSANHIGCQIHPFKLPERQKILYPFYTQPEYP